MEKICNKCLIKKNISFFYKNKNNEDGYNNICKKCKKETCQKYYKKNIEKIKEYREIRKEEQNQYSKNYYRNNIDKIKEYRKNNEETLKLKRKEYYLNNRGKMIEKSKNYKSQNKEKIQEYNKKYRKDNLDCEINRWKKYYDNNREVLIKKKCDYSKEKRKSSPLELLKHNIRNRTNEFLKSKNIRKTNKTFDIIGCSPEFLKEYIEKQFTEGMSWTLMGAYIHIDHIIPLSSAKTEEELYKLCNYTNLQPLWAVDNLKKSNKIINKQK